VWVLGDQLGRDTGALRDAVPGETTVLLVYSRALLHARRWHRRRLHLVLASMRRFAAALREEGFDVDERDAPTLAAGVRAHLRARRPGWVRVMEPASFDGLQTARALGCELVPSDQFLCHPAEFAAWASGRSTLRLEDFYRWQRRRHGYLLDGDEPAGGRWNFDRENREPPPRGPVDWPRAPRVPLDDVDREVLASLPASAWGADPEGWWPTSRAHALALLEHVVTDVLPVFGPYEDAMLADEWRLNHTLLSSSLNLGLLHPREVCDAAEAAHRAGAVQIASAEGFVRQVLGWREYVWGVYWLWMPGYREENALGATRPLPPLFHGAPTRMRCVAETMHGVHERAWAHHIQRLIVLGNLCLLAGVRPDQVVEWMWASFVDGAEWVMLPNVVGMALHADGGRMATKPYAAGGNYIDRMSDYCGGCAYDRRARTGDRACPFTTLYWDFLDRHRERLAHNHRVAPQVRALDRLSDLSAVRARATEVLGLLDRGAL
jgi:deoxyribodipyrimidine photolyase-related protein